MLENVLVRTFTPSVPLRGPERRQAHGSSAHERFDADPRPAQGGHRQLDRQRRRVLRLLHLRHRRGLVFPQDLLPRLPTRPSPPCSPLRDFRRRATSRGRSAPSSWATSATRSGRKKVLTFTLLLMGVVDLPDRRPAVLRARSASPRRSCSWLLRLLQGLSAAGEQAGANSMTLEHAPEHRRAFFTSFTLSGTQIGFILATLVFLPISALPEDQLLSLGLAHSVLPERDRRRRRLLDPPHPARDAGVREGERGARGAPSCRWPSCSATTGGACCASSSRALVSVVSTIVRRVRALVRGQHDPAWTAPTMLMLLVAANLVALAAIPLWATLSDRIGRRPVFLVRRARLGGR